MNYDLNSNDYYKILGVDKNSDLKTIKKAYHKLAIKYHPDKNQNNKEHYGKLFNKIQSAYTHLSNSYERKQFDNYQKNQSHNFNQTNNDDNSNMFSSFFSNSNSKDFETNSFSYNFSNLDGSIDVNFNYSTYSNFNQEYNNMQNNLNQFKINEAELFDKGQELKIPNSTKVLIKSKGIHGYVKDYTHGFYQIYIENDDCEIHFDDLQQILKGKLYDLKGDYSHLNGDYCDILKYEPEFNKFLIHIYGCDLVVNLDNIIINNESYVQIHNLQNQKDLNNQWGIILAYDFNKKRYLIKIKNNKLVKVSYKNIIL